MTSFGNIRRYLATTARKPWFTLYVIHLFVRGVFSMVWVLMYSTAWALVSYVYTILIFSNMFV